MNSIFMNNPDAFINNSKNRIKAGAELSIPVVGYVSKDKVVSEQELVEQKTPEISLNDSSIKKQNLSSQNGNIEDLGLKADEYRVMEGDTLSSITTKIGYKEVPFAKMLNAIFETNPNAFIQGNMTNLSIGSVIKLPQISSLGLSAAQASKVNRTIPSTSNSKSSPPTDLIKRIRELRKELKQNKDSLSEMKGRLNQKEILLQQKNNQLDTLKTTLKKLNESIEQESLLKTSLAITEQTLPAAVTADFPKQKITAAKADAYSPFVKEKINELKSELSHRQEKTNKQLTRIRELKNKTMSPNDLVSNPESLGLFKQYAESNIAHFTKSNYSYLTIALLLSLLLVRYRRELYRYSYSTINYNQESYYPVPEAGKYELKEKNINYHDAKMDRETIANEGFLAEDKATELAEPKVIISPLLVDATEEIFITTEDQKQIEHCEHLVTELFDDLKVTDNSNGNSDWNDIEKVCDTYIEKIKDEDSDLAAKENGALVEEAADFNNMMSDLLESLDKVDKSVKRNNIKDDAFSDLKSSNRAEIEINENRA